MLLQMMRYSCECAWALNRRTADKTAARPTGKKVRLRPPSASEVSPFFRDTAGSAAVGIDRRMERACESSSQIKGVIVIAHRRLRNQRAGCLSLARHLASVEVSFSGSDSMIE